MRWRRRWHGRVRRSLRGRIARAVMAALSGVEKMPWEQAQARVTHSILGAMTRRERAAILRRIWEVTVD